MFIEGVKINLKKILAVQEQLIPKTVKDVQSFLGFANYYQKFIKDYLKIIVPLSKITKKKTEFSQNKEQQEAFNQIKQIFLKAPILEIYNLKRETRVKTNALDYALGAVLLQQCLDKKQRLVFYYLRKFSRAELNYNVYNKELIGIVNAFK